MTIKEITDLRKGGHLQEAFAAAKTEFNNNQNKYTAGALFWCYYDIIKQPGMFGFEAEEIYSQMFQLYEEHLTLDDYAERAVEWVQKKLDPYSQTIRCAIEDAKRGINIITTYREIKNNFENLSDRSYNDYGWLIYYALKQTSINDVEGRKELLFGYLRLNLERPSLLHSLILGEAIKVEQNNASQFQMRQFIDQWGIENLREEDWNQFTTDSGIVVSSNVEKLISVYTKELKSDNICATETFFNLVDRAIEKFPNNQYLPYYKAQLFIIQNDIEQAITYYKNLILQNPAIQYLWQHLSEIVSDENIRQALLCRAIKSGVDEKFISNYRVQLAEMLIKQELYGNAKTELDKHIETYTQNGWGIKPEVRQLAGRLPQGTQATNNDELYARYISIAEDYVYSALPIIYAVKTNSRQVQDRNNPRKNIIFWDLQSETSRYSLKKPSKFGLDMRTANGTIFKVRVYNDKIVWICEEQTPPQLVWFKKAYGEVSIRTDRNGNPYTIIDGVYVGKRLLQNVNNGDCIVIKAIRDKDGRWSAIAIQANHGKSCGTY